MPQVAASDQVADFLGRCRMSMLSMIINHSACILRSNFVSISFFGGPAHIVLTGIRVYAASHAGGNMPTDSDPACRGGRKRRRVTLKQNVESPYDTGKSIVKGHRGLQEASKRSALLSGIEMTPERANIPGNMTQEDAELWKTACMKGIQPRMEDLVKAVKVRESTDSDACATVRIWAAPGKMLR